VVPIRAVSDDGGLGGDAEIEGAHGLARPDLSFGLDFEFDHLVGMALADSGRPRGHRAGFLSIKKGAAVGDTDGERFASPLLVHSPKLGGMKQDGEGRQTGKSPTIKDF
jgi:hypothetical protein